MLGSEFDERTGLAGLGWAGLGWSSCLVTTGTNDVLRWTLAPAAAGHYLHCHTAALNTRDKWQHLHCPVGNIHF